MASRVLPGAPVLTCTSSLNTCAPPNTNTTTQHATEVHGRARPRRQRTHWAVPATSPKLYIFAPERILLTAVLIRVDPVARSQRGQTSQPRLRALPSIAPRLSPPPAPRGCAPPLYARGPLSWRKPPLWGSGPASRKAGTKGRHPWPPRAL